MSQPQKNEYKNENNGEFDIISGFYLAKWQINFSSSINIPVEPLWFDGDNKKPKIPKSFSRKCRKIPKSLLNDTNEIQELIIIGTTRETNENLK